jgi:hypothetical protein
VNALSILRRALPSTDIVLLLMYGGFSPETIVPSCFFLGLCAKNLLVTIYLVYFQMLGCILHYNVCTWVFIKVSHLLFCIFLGLCAKNLLVTIYLVHSQTLLGYILHYNVCTWVFIKVSHLLFCIFLFSI